MKKLLLLSLMGLALVACDQSTKTDRTANPTAADQNENAADREISQRVRQFLMDDGSLANVSKTIVIVTQNGVVTLRGSVTSDMEKMKIDRQTKMVPGVKNVVNNLDVATNR